MYFDRQEGIEPSNDRVVRVAQQLRNPQVKHAMKPLNKFSFAFQTSTSRIGRLQSDV